MNQWRIITVRNSATSIDFSGATIASGSGRTWTVGGSWVTIGKALGASGIASGDTAYVGAGIYREAITVAMTSATAETKLIGDVDGGQTGDAGEVRWTAHVTNDTTNATGRTLDLAGRDFLTFQNITFCGGANNIVQAATGDTTNITWTDCTFLSGGKGNNAMFNLTASTAVAWHWLFNRCRFLAGSGAAFTLTPVLHASADYDLDFVVRNCMFVGGSSSGVIFGAAPSGGNTFKPGGMILEACTMIGSLRPLTITTNYSSSIPCILRNNFGFICGNNVVTGAAAGAQVTDNYNLWVTNGTIGTNITAGANTIIDGSYSPLIHIGQELQFGGMFRPLGTPTVGSPLLGFGNTSGQTVDILNNSRPGGGASASNAIGAYERANTWGKETGTVRTGSNAVSITGPGVQDFSLPVDATSTTVSVYMRYDGTYAGTKPQIQVLNGTECGVANATSSAVTTVNTWEQISLTIVPTSAGIVTIRLLSSDTNGAGKAFADDVAVA